MQLIYYEKQHSNSKYILPVQIQYISFLINFRKSVSLPRRALQLSHLSLDIKKSYNFQIGALSRRYILYRISEANNIFYQILMSKK